jgi:hypothetical protein
MERGLSSSPRSAARIKMRGCGPCGQRLRPDDWKLIFLDGLNRELRMVPNIAGNGWVNLGRSSSDLSTAEMSDMMELMAAFGAEHGVKFGDETR